MAGVFILALHADHCRAVGGNSCTGWVVCRSVCLQIVLKWNDQGFVLVGIPIYYLTQRDTGLGGMNMAFRSPTVC